MKVRRKTSKAANHPTRERLVDTVVALISTDPDDLRIELILAESGVSSGSLYHHFEDVDHLIESAYARRFAMFVDVGVAMLTKVAEDAHDRESMLEGLFEVTRNTQGAALAPIRYERARIVAMAEHNERFRETLKAEQQRLTDALTDLIREAQERGWMSRDFDPRVGAVMIQAYTLGKVVDDFVDDQMDPDAWVETVNRLIERLFA